MTSPQRACRAISEGGCYFLCLLRIAEVELKRTIDVLDAYWRAITTAAPGNSTTQYAIMGEDCYVNDPAALLSLLCGGKWAVRKTGPVILPWRNEYEVLRYENGALSHFVLGDGDGHVAWDPYGESATVRDGQLTSKRILGRAS